ncbi:MAG: family 1 glycosylhydrolase [Candidatus Babeliales bacterium]
MTNRKFKKTVFLLNAFVSIVSQSAVTDWDWWSCINTDAVEIPAHFLWGTAISEYQNSGADCCTNTNWSKWEDEKKIEKSGKACDFWNRYPEDIELIKNLGVNSFRFSVEWCKIEPEEGKFNKAALDHYVDLCDKLIEAGITPMITLHHFVNPSWFDEKGGFEEEKNLYYFERFCIKVFEHLSGKVNLWCTINEPTIYVFQGYLRGVFPPGKLMNMPLALRVLKNLLQVHTHVYHSLKSMPHGDTAQIGLVHQYLVFEPYTSWNPLERVPGLLFNYVLNTGVLKFLKTGTFNIKIPGLGEFFSYTAPKDKPLMDFIGLNYYSHPLMKGQLSFRDPLITTNYANEVMTDMPYRMCPVGFYKAIKHMSEFNVPIYITENGIADAQDKNRETFLRQYIFAMQKAIDEGCDVRGYYYWSLMDNYEWDMGYSMKFGLYAVDHDTQERALRTSAHYYKNIIAQSKAA